METIRTDRGVEIILIPYVECGHEYDWAGVGFSTDHCDEDCDYYEACKECEPIVNDKVNYEFHGVVVARKTKLIG